MNKVRFACPGCGKQFQVGTDKAGRKTKCRECGTSITIPSPQVVSETPASDASGDVAATVAPTETMFNPFQPPQSSYEPNGQIESVGGFVAGTALSAIVTGVVVPLAAIICGVIAGATYMVLWSKIVNIVGETVAVGIPVVIGGGLIFCVVAVTSAYLPHFFQKIARNHNPMLGSLAGMISGIVASVGIVAFLIKTGNEPDYETFAGIYKFAISAGYVILPLVAVVAASAGGYMGAAEPYCTKCNTYSQPKAAKRWYGMDGETFRKAVEESDHETLITGKGEIELPFVQLGHSRCKCGELLTITISENQTVNNNVSAEAMVSHAYVGEKSEGLGLLLKTGVRVKE